MQKLIIVLIDKDEIYLQPVWKKFSDELGNNAEISMITEEEYIDIYFSAPQRIDILLVNEELHISSLQKHDIANVFILSERITEKAGYIYKYTSVKEIYDYVISNVGSETINKSGPSCKTKLIVFYSPVGGCGTTTISDYAAKLLAEKHRTLYISMEDMQSVYAQINCDRYMDKGFEQMMLHDDDSLLNALDSEIYSEGCDYLLPVRTRFSTMKPKPAHYISIIKKLIGLQRHEYIIVDTSSALDDEKTGLLSLADKVVILTRQDRISAWKIDNLMELIDCSNQSKFIFICNMYNETNENHLNYKFMKNPCLIRAYIGINSDGLGLDRENEKKVLEKIVSMITIV